MFKMKLIERLRATNKDFHPGFNRSACAYFDRIMKDTGCTNQHALNGGEHFLKELGYWLDGYDSKNNIVYEYDERRHFDVYGNLKEKDKIRQMEIERLMLCKFVRIRWDDSALKDHNKIEIPLRA